MADDSSFITSIALSDMLSNYQQHFTKVKQSVNDVISGLYELEIKKDFTETLSDLNDKVNNEALNSKAFLSSFGQSSDNMKSISGLYTYWKGITGKDYSGNGLLTLKRWYKNAYHFIPNNTEKPFGLDLINFGSRHNTYIDRSNEMKCDRYILVDTEIQKVYPVRTMHKNPFSNRFPFDAEIKGIDPNIDVEKFSTVFGNNHKSIKLNLSGANDFTNVSDMLSVNETPISAYGSYHYLDQNISSLTFNPRFPLFSNIVINGNEIAETGRIELSSYLTSIANSIDIYFGIGRFNLNLSVTGNDTMLNVVSNYLSVDGNSIPNEYGIYFYSNVNNISFRGTKYVYLKYQNPNGSWTTSGEEGDAIRTCYLTADTNISIVLEYCLSPDTEILMGDGSIKVLSNMVIGDEVAALNPETNELTTDIVVKTSIGTNSHSDDWEFSDGSKITTVGRHRFYNHDLNEFMYLEAWNDNESAVKSDLSLVKLVKHVHHNESSSYMTIFTEKYNNYFANGLLAGNRHSLKLNI